MLVAAGMDTRAYRLDWPASTTVFELDRPELLRLKDELLTDQITALPAPGSQLLIDLVGQSLLGSPALRPMLAFAARDMTWVFGTDEPEELLEPRGWHTEVSTIAGVGTQLGRWPFPDIPRGTPGVPHGYLVHASTASGS